MSTQGWLLGVWGVALRWGESGSKKISHEFYQLDHSLCCRRGALGLEGFSKGNKGQRRGLFPGARIHSQGDLALISFISIAVFPPSFSRPS